MLTTEERQAPASVSLPAMTGDWNPRLLAGLAPFVRWMAVWALACAVTLGTVILTLHPPTNHLATLMRYLLVGGAASVALAGAARWITDVARIGGVRIKFAVPALLTALIISFNVLLVAHAMFLSQADSLLVLDILVFGVIVALTLSASIARPVATAIQRVEAGARRMVGGEYSVRLPETGQNGARELDQLAHWFNQMAASVEDAFGQRERAEQERRQVVAALSHDLRTPLASVRAMIEAITDGVVTEPATVARYQRTIHAEVRHLSSLIDDLFELSRLEAGSQGNLGLQREPIALDDLISDALEAMHSQANRWGIHLTGRVEGELPPIAVEARHIHRVLTNLVQNALRHTPCGGQIVIHAQLDEVATNGPQVFVRVVDSGEGIATCDLPHIFEPMYRGEPARQRNTSATDGRAIDLVAAGVVPVASGAGLGLAIARRLIEAHGGRMWAESPLAPATAALLCADEGVGHAAFSAQGPGACINFILPCAALGPVSLAR